MDQVGKPYKRRNFSMNLALDVEEINLEGDHTTFVGDDCKLELSRISDQEDDYFASNSVAFEEMTPMANISNRTEFLNTSCKYLYHSALARETNHKKR